MDIEKAYEGRDLVDKMNARASGGVPRHLKAQRRLTHGDKGQPHG
tara:strand:- start:1929 stop:2063 length:135 start_codon:yes stop_codon:yes gene_type:complete